MRFMPLTSRAIVAVCAVAAGLAAAQFGASPVRAQSAGGAGYSQPSNQATQQAVEDAREQAQRLLRERSEQGLQKPADRCW